MSGKGTFEGEKLPFTRNGWTRQLKSGTFRNGSTWRHVEKVRAVGFGTIGAKLEEVFIIASWDIDKGGNKTKDHRKGQHFLSLIKGNKELAFAVDTKSGWRILTYDCSHYEIVKTQQQAEEILRTINWRRWAGAGRGSRYIKTLKSAIKGN